MSAISYAQAFRANRAVSFVAFDLTGRPGFKDA